MEPALAGIASATLIASIVAAHLQYFIAFLSVLGRSKSGVDHYLLPAYELQTNEQSTTRTVLTVLIVITMLLHLAPHGPNTGLPRVDQIEYREKDQVCKGVGQTPDQPRCPGNPQVNREDRNKDRSPVSPADDEMPSSSRKPSHYDNAQRSQSDRPSRQEQGGNH
jgi:hypothetical protein